jgi:ATP-dependent Clp protease ATP-binding subunit ClpX
MDDSYQQRVNTHTKCNFCNRRQSQVKILIAGPGRVYICDNRIELAHSIIFAERLEEIKEQPHFPTPFEIKSALDEYNIGQKSIEKNELNFNNLKQAIGV